MGICELTVDFSSHFFINHRTSGLEWAVITAVRSAAEYRADLRAWKGATAAHEISRRRPQNKSV